MWNASANVLRTSSASPSRSSPLSTKMQVCRSPIALWMSTAATLESTPPESPQITDSFGPTCARIDATASSTKEPIVQSPLSPQTPKRKFPRICAPCAVWVTSGWNWTPWSGAVACRTAAKGVLGDVAVVSKPAPGFTTLSPWLIHTSRLGPSPRNRPSVDGDVDDARARTRACRPG